MQPSVAPQKGLMRRTLPGEYLALAFMLHAGVGALVWALLAVSTPAAWLVIAAGGWVFYRAAGGSPQRFLAPLLSAGLLVALLMLNLSNGDLPRPALWVFSLPVFAAMLVVVLVLDLAEIAWPGRTSGEPSDA